MRVSIDSNGGSVLGTRDALRIESCEIDYEKFRRDLLTHFSGRRRLAISKGFEELRDDFVTYGVYFWIWLPSGLDRQDYRLIGREIAFFVRSYIRRVLGDYERIKKGFEDSVRADSN